MRKRPNAEPEQTVEVTATELKVMLGNMAIFEKRLDDISSKVADGFEGRDYFDFDFKKLGANYASICLDIENLREITREMKSMLGALKKASDNG